MRLVPLLGAWLWQVAGSRRRGGGTPEMREFMAFVRANLDRLNWTLWHEEHFPALGLQLVTDASESGIGAHVRQGLAQPWQAAISFGSDVMDGRHSSTKREVLAQRLALKELLRTHSRQVRGRQVQIWGDNQAAIADCKRMRGCPLVLEEVRKLYLLAWGHQLRLSFVWQPRSQRDLVRADLLSKRTDPSDWRLSRKFAREQIFPQLGWPDVDCFASQEAHQVETYYAAVWDGKCKAVDGWAQNWAGWPEGIGLPRRPLCFVFPPVHKVGEALSKINREKAEAILVCPVRLRLSLSHQLESLPVRGTVRLQGPHQVLMQPTRAVPAEVRTGGWKVALQAVRIAWPGEGRPNG
jgi:hypothetical protein